MSEHSGLKMNPVEGAPDGFTVIRFEGVLDENTAGDARAALDRMIQGDTSPNLIFDLTDLSYINSKGIGFLVSVHAHISRDQKKLILVNPNEPVMDVMTLVGINTIIDTFKTLEEAYGTLGK